MQVKVRSCTQGLDSIQPFRKDYDDHHVFTHRKQCLQQGIGLVLDKLQEVQLVSQRTLASSTSELSLYLC